MLRLSKVAQTLHIIGHIEDFTKGYIDAEIIDIVKSAVGYRCTTVRINDVASQSDFLQNFGFKITTDKSNNDIAIYEAKLSDLANKIFGKNVFRLQLISQYGVQREILHLAASIDEANAYAQQRLKPCSHEYINVAQIS